MTLLVGIPLVSLFDITDRLNEALPQVVRDIVERFSATSLRSRTSPAAFIHTGVVQSIADIAQGQSGPIALPFGTLNIPGGTSGLPFQLTLFRDAIADNLEPSSDRWILDISFDNLDLTLTGLRGARLIEAQGTFPRHLAALPGSNPVTITGRATLRLERLAPGQPIVTRLIDRSDPLDPSALTGGTAAITVSPPHFFVGKSQFGMTIKDLLFDFSDIYSPPQVINRGQDAEWMGLAIGEATFYCPRNALGKGGFSAGVKNLLIGSPAGLHGELELQWGRTSLDPATVLFTQKRPDDPSAEVAVGANGNGVVMIEAGHDELVDMHVDFQNPEPPEGGAITDWEWEFTWPDNTTSLLGKPPNGPFDADFGKVRHGQELKIVPIEAIDGLPKIRHPEQVFRFTSAGNGPQIDMQIDGESFANVTHVSGPAARLAAMELTATSTAPDPTQSTFIWLETSNNKEHKGEPYSPPIADKTGKTGIKLTERTTDGKKFERNSFLELEVIKDTDLQIGCEAGVFRVDSTATRSGPHAPSKMKGSFELAHWHVKGERKGSADHAKLENLEATGVEIPAGVLALVETEEGATTPEFDRHIQVLMEFDSTAMINWGDANPAKCPSTTPGALPGELLKWAANYPDSTFLVIGRCDDVGDNDYNSDLALYRAIRIENILTGLSNGASDIPSTRVKRRGEQQADPSGLPDDNTIGEIDDDPRNPDEIAAQRLIFEEQQNRLRWPTGRDSQHPSEDIRAKYRRVDIYAFGGTPLDGAISGRKDTPNQPPVRRDSLIPAPGRAVSPAKPLTPSGDYRVMLKLGWDKPHASGLGDLTPSLAEFEYAWSPAEANTGTFNFNNSGVPLQGSREVYTFYGKWIHDDLTDFTKVTLGLRSDGDRNGLAATANRQLNAATAFGPMLLSSIDGDVDTVGEGGRLAAFGVLAAAAQFIIEDGSAQPCCTGLIVVETCPFPPRSDNALILCPTKFSHMVEHF